jgi:hypothetical protein
LLFTLKFYHILLFFCFFLRIIALQTNQYVFIEKCFKRLDFLIFSWKSIDFQFSTQIFELKQSKLDYLFFFFPFVFFSFMSSRFFLLRIRKKSRIQINIWKKKQKKIKNFSIKKCVNSYHMCNFARLLRKKNN